ncbi:MAG: hypothetical protein WAV32_01600 [Halobacteriota archaeon]
MGVPDAKPGRRGRKPSRSRVLSPDKPLKVSEVARRDDTNWRRVRVRDTELGWDELEAQKYLAWMHHLAMTILALWFITQTKAE